MASATMGLRRRVPVNNSPTVAAAPSSHHSPGKRSRTENNNSPSHGNLNCEPSAKKARGNCLSTARAMEGSRRGSSNARCRGKSPQIASVTSAATGNPSVVNREPDLTPNFSVMNPTAWSVPTSLSETVSYAAMSGLSVPGGQNNLCNAGLTMPAAIPYMATSMATFVGNATNLSKNSSVSYLDISNMTSGSLTSTNGMNSYVCSKTSSPPEVKSTVPMTFSSPYNPTKNVKNDPKKTFQNDSMFNAYQPWVIKTYGDLAKTKTITIKKYARILRTLRGEEVNSAENSKFRFWVKSKGFHIGQPEGYDAKPADRIIGRHAVTSPGLDPPLYVPTQLPHSKVSHALIFFYLL